MASILDILKDAKEDVAKKETKPLVDPVQTSEPPAQEGEIFDVTSVPAAPQPEVTQKTIRTPLTPDLKRLSEEQEAITKKRQKAVQTVADIDALEAQEELQAREEQLREQELIRAQEQQNLQEVEAEVEAGQARVDTLRQELEQMDAKTFWQRDDTEKKVLMSLAIILGGIGQGLSGAKENAALRAMDRAVEQDLATRKLAIQKKLKAIDLAKLSVKEKQAKKREIKESFEAIKQASITRLADKVKIAATRHKSERVQAKAQELMAEFEQALVEKQQEAAQEIAGTVETTTKLVTKFNELPKDQAEAASIIDKKSAGMVNIRNEVASALQQLQDPSLSRDDKLRIGSQLVKTLNSTQGSDAVGAEEAARLAGELQGNIGKVGTGLGTGLAAGAVAGSAVPALGTFAGAGIGALGGGLAGLLDAIDDPGGLRFRADVEGFTKRVELTLKKLDATMKRNQVVSNLLRKGKQLPEAQALAEKMLQKRLEGGK
jgi:hypothetical protein